MTTLSYNNMNKPPQSSCHLVDTPNMHENPLNPTTDSFIQFKLSHTNGANNMLLLVS